MPLVRFQVKSEYSLGQPQLYKEANREDPKAVLDGVAVAGLVGILRQLGDLAEFAAEVFHGLQEQVTTTASRSHKLMVRVQHIEAALPPLEKAVLAQTSHIHFAYTAGLEWHPRIRSERHHFIYNDLPRFIMDSYEECSDPPRLHLLDKFDTGGPGSCLKRYSDPTFFKRTSVVPDEATAEKLQRDGKAHRSKKKKGSQNNGDVSRPASISNHSSRRQPISSNVNGRSSPSRTISSTDMAAVKSDLGNNSNSFSSRTDLGYNEYVAHSSSSLQAKQEEYKESPSSESVLRNDTFECVLRDGETVFVDGNSPASSLQDQVTSGSSCGKWDEKAEIVDPTGQQMYLDETTEMLPTMDELDAHEGRADNSRSIQQNDFLFDGENILEPTSSGNQIDEIDSGPDEPDTFMDALNTIESESDNDLDCQTKREVKPVPTFVNKEGPDGIQEITTDCVNPHTPRFETQRATSHTFPKREMPVDLPSLASLESTVPEQNPQVGVEPSNSNYYVGSDRTEIIDDSRSETVVCDSAPSSSGTTTVQDKIISSLHELQDSPADISRSNSLNFWTNGGMNESQDSPADISRSNSINFWTNGGMLGLEPSKPPDFSMASPVNPASKSTAETNGISNYAYKVIVDENEMEPSMLTMDDRCNDKGQGDDISSEKISNGVSPVDLCTKLGNIGDSNKSNGFDHVLEDGWRKTNTLEPEIVLPVAPYAKSASNDLNQENSENSSLVFGLGRRLLENGFGRNVSFDKFEPARYMYADELEQKSEHQRLVYQSYPGTAFQEQSEDGFAAHSSPSSPPLEHMKISFQPINGNETSKLKLKLSDGNQSHGSVRDMFQSFQLIPEPAVPLHEFGSDSDDDTFCRSSPYISDDCVSHQSEFNSEQWESSATPDRDNHESYNALRGISSVEHISSSPELGEIASNAIYSDGGIKSIYSENGLVQYLSDPLFDLASLDAFKPVLLQEPKDDSALMDAHGLRCPAESTPGPPPLPPVEWCLSKPQFNATEEIRDVSEGFKHVPNTDPLGSITFQQPPLKQQEVNEELVCIEPKITNQQVNEHQKSDQALNSKEIDENDFLQQIRARSVNLRRTVTAKPMTTTPGPATHVKVTAILEKANAIRQAVGSDDGDDDDDDTWSDT
ncbi:protein SCAR3 isoform X2 [Argentina anserina]|uniref:protein SCAR3 isoform X2 n=1 Tax=Argentina anserina TaxID=57926 RepID=UPI0021763ACC|nr:protein SCAR3 isoform X2 [Potentilla anserina]